MHLTSLFFISALSFLNHISHAFPLKPQAPPKQPVVQRRVAYSVVAVDGGSAATPPATPVPGTLTLIQTSDSIVTVTAPTSSLLPSIETVVATKVVSELEPGKTVDVIITQDVTKIPSPTAITSYIVVNPAETPTSSSPMPLTSQTFTNGISVECAISESISTITSAISSISTQPSISTTSIPLESLYRVSEAAHPAETKKELGAAPRIASALPPPPPPSPLAITSSRSLPTGSSKTYDGMWHTSYPVWNATSTVSPSASATAVGTGRAQNLWKRW